MTDDHIEELRCLSGDECCEGPNAPKELCCDECAIEKAEREMEQAEALCNPWR